MVAGDWIIDDTFAQSDNLSARTYEQCIDVNDSKGLDHPLDITFRDNRGLSLLNGRRTVGTAAQEYTNYVPSGQKTLLAHPSSSIPSIGASALTLRARTNPSREEVSLPVFIAELKDLPGMLKDTWRLKVVLRNAFRKGFVSKSRIASGHYLAYQFGWKPMISDIQKMFQFQAEVDRRNDELNRLYSSSGLKRRLKLYSEILTDEDSDVTIDSSLGILIRVRKIRVTKIERWGTIRWRPTAVPPVSSRQDLGRLARKLVFGLNHRGLDAAQAWELIPWSWLIDWFGNFDEWLQAHRNDIPAEPTGPCNIMTRTTTYETWQRIDGFQTSITGASGVRSLETKQRSQSSGSLSVTLPYLSGRQWSILGALNLQRLRVR